MAAAEERQPQELPPPAPSPGRQLLSVAPMMEWTDVHFRQLARILSRRTWLWTEMVVDTTVIHTPNQDRYLWFPAEQRPIVLQLGGSNPNNLAAAVKKVLQYGYDEINLNCGCPSDRVAGAGCFGAALMLRPELVAQCMAAMGEAADGTPVTVKCRLGVDQVDSYETVHKFVKTVSEGSPVRHFIIHARKCFLKGLNPHQNRTVPPLKYEWVYGLKRDFPHLRFSLNGGIQGPYEANAYIAFTGPFGDVDPTPGGGDTQGSEGMQGPGSASPAPREQPANADAGAGPTPGPAGSLQGEQWLEGIMIGRQAYNDPWGVLGDADRAVFGEPTNPTRSRRHALQLYSEYAAAMQAKWRQPDGQIDRIWRVRPMTKPLLNLFHGEKGSKQWKALVDNLMQQDPPSVEWVLANSLHVLSDEALDAPPRAGPCVVAASRGISSATPPPQVTLPRLPGPGDRSGRCQEPDGVDRKRQRQHSSSPAAVRTEAAATTAATTDSACVAAAATPAVDAPMPVSSAAVMV